MWFLLISFLLAPSSHQVRALKIEIGYVKMDFFSWFLDLLAAGRVTVANITRDGSSD